MQGFSYPGYRTAHQRGQQHGFGGGNSFGQGMNDAMGGGPDALAQQWRAMHAQNAGAMPMPSGPNPSLMQRNPDGSGGHTLDPSVMQRLFPQMGMPDGTASQVPVTPMQGGAGSGAEAGTFSNGMPDNLRGLRAMGK